MEETSLEKGFLNRDNFRGRVGIFYGEELRFIFFFKTKMYYTSRVTRTVIHVF